LNCTCFLLQVPRFLQRLGRRLSIATGVSLLAAVLPVASSAVELSPVRIPRVSRAPKLEDFASGTPREAEAVVDIFRQFDPHDGEPVSQPTTAYLSYDDKNLYVGWICKDEPAKIHARVAPRKQIELDDRVTINIDTFQDHKHAYWFDVNPYGIQYDGRTTDGIGDDPRWEGLWYSEGKITEDGYVVLETIPFRTMRFPRASKQVWYICLARAIQRNNEWSMWPFISHARLPQFVGQFAPIEIDDDISPGRNLQFIPFGLASHNNYLDPNAGFQQQTEHREGVDAKAVIHDALTFDLAINPDFSEIGSDDPKVQVNQRYEVTFPERRPFFIENASIFTMPEKLFFSRRIINPQFGAKLTGSINRWSMGALVADDRAPGEVLQPGEPGHDDRAIDVVSRVEREFAHQSHVGLFTEGTKFMSSSNRVGSVDLRYVMPRNWTMSAQATTTHTQSDSEDPTGGPGYIVNLKKSDNHVTLQNFYTDRSPGMYAPLGYISRNDIRRGETYASYQWKPAKNQTVMAYGPTMDGIIIYDHEGRLQNWSLMPGFEITLPRMTSLSVSHGESYELYQDNGFRQQSTAVGVTTSWFKWIDMYATYTQGTLPNYYPSPGVNPFLAYNNAASADVTFYPQTHLRLDEIYYYTRLAALHDLLPSSSLPTGVIFTNHLIRSKINYQFTPAYSFRAILDYNTLLPNDQLVSSAYSKLADATLLFTYLPHPGTAFYVGYADTFQNVDYEADAVPPLVLTNFPGTSTDRQLFVKFSYLLRF
jgi:Domain of unknown function (DUF5916)/Carbohydrate family 9 binding domain-like